MSKFMICHLKIRKFGIQVFYSIALELISAHLYMTRRFCFGSPFFDRVVFLSLFFFNHIHIENEQLSMPQWGKLRKLLLLGVLTRG